MLLLVHIALLIFFRRGIGKSGAAQQGGRTQSQCDLRLVHGLLLTPRVRDWAH
jgi:hypothetical protein